MRVMKRKYLQDNGYHGNVVLMNLVLLQVARARQDNIERR